MDYLWVVLAVITALIVNLDGRVGHPYFAFAEVVFGYPELRATYSSRSLWYAMLRRATYPLASGVAIGFLTRPLVEAALTGFMGIFLLIWPVLMHGLPGEYPRGMVLLTYLGLLLMGSGLAVLGWFIAEGFGSPGGLLTFLADEVVGIIIGVILSAFGANIAYASSRAIRD